MTEPRIDAERLKALREERGLSQGQLAYKSKVTQATISRLERGMHPTSTLGTVYKLADALEVPPAELMPRSAASGEPEYIPGVTDIAARRVMNARRGQDIPHLIRLVEENNRLLRELLQRIGGSPIN